MKWWRSRTDTVPFPYGEEAVKMARARNFYSIDRVVLRCMIGIAAALDGAFHGRFSCNWNAHGVGSCQSTY